MTQTIFTDEQLMAFADGEADMQTSLAIADVLKTDKTLSQRLAVFSITRNIAKQALPLQPVPLGMEARIRAMAAGSGTATSAPNNVAPMAASAPKPMNPANSNIRFWQIPMAASIALMVGLSGGYWMFSRQANETVGLDVTALVDSSLKTTLSSLPSGASEQLGENQFHAIASFKDAKGNLCREFEKVFKTGSAITGIACYDNTQWNMRAVVATNSQEDGYTPASSLDAIEAFVQSSGAGPTLTVEEEKAALQAIR